MWLKVNYCIVQICDISYVANTEFMLLNFRGKDWNEMICKVSSDPNDFMIMYMLSCGSRLSKNLNLKRKNKVSVIHVARSTAAFAVASLHLKFDVAPY